MLDVLVAGGPMTDEQLQQTYSEQRGLPAQSPSGLRTRRAELVDAGLVEPTGDKRPMTTGRLARVWRATTTEGAAPMTTTPTEELHHYTQLIAAARRQLADAAVIIDGEEVDLHAHAAYFDQLDQLLVEVRMAHSLAARELGERLRAEHVDLLDREVGAPVKLNVSKSRKAWQSDVLRVDALRAARERAQVDSLVAAVDPSTGEPVLTWQQAVDAVSGLWSLSGSNVRLTALRELGLDPDDYCEGGPDRPTYTAAVVR